MKNKTWPKNSCFVFCVKTFNVRRLSFIFPRDNWWKFLSFTQFNLRPIFKKKNIFLVESLETTYYILSSRDATSPISMIVSLFMNISRANRDFEQKIYFIILMEHLIHLHSFQTASVYLP